MSKHTIGPWRYRKFVDNPPGQNTPLIGFKVTAHEEIGEVTICESFPKPCPVAVNEDNARLIAAAPDLLLMLIRLAEKVERANTLQEVLTEDWDELAMLCGEARAVIQKAQDEE